MSSQDPGIKKNYEPIVNNDINPFHNDIIERLTLMQKIQVVLCSFTLAPLRVILLLLSFIFLWPVGIILNYGRTEEEKSVPMKGWRKTFLPIARFFSRCVFWSAGYHYIKITGTPDMTSPILIFAPHTGFFDSMLVTYLNFVSVVGRAGSDQIHLFGNLTALCQPIIVDRERQESRIQSVQQVQNRVKSDLEWPPLSIFAEGTCTNRKCLIKFKQGAFIPGVPVQPVCFKYCDQIMDTSSWTWDGPHWLLIIWLALCQVHSPVEFIFLPMYHPSDEEKSNPELYAENVRRLMAGTLELPLSDYSYEDAKFMYRVKKFGLPGKTGLVDIQNLKKKSGVKVDEIYRILPQYSNVSDKVTGLCYSEKFSRNLGLVHNDHVMRLFNIFDKEKIGNFTLINFVETYFEVINPHLTKDVESHIKKVLDMFPKFKESSSYSTEKFNSIVKDKFQIEFSNFDAFNIKEENTIDEEIFIEFLNKNTLVLYLFGLTAPRS